MRRLAALSAEMRARSAAVSFRRRLVIGHPVSSFHPPPAGG